MSYKTKMQNLKLASLATLAFGGTISTDAAECRYFQSMHRILIGCKWICTTRRSQRTHIAILFHIHTELYNNITNDDYYCSSACVRLREPENIYYIILLQLSPNSGNSRFCGIAIPRVDNPFVEDWTYSASPLRPAPPSLPLTINPRPDACMGILDLPHRRFIKSCNNGCTE